MATAGLLDRLDAEPVPSGVGDRDGEVGSVLFASLSGWCTLLLAAAILLSRARRARRAGRSEGDALSTP